MAIIEFTAAIEQFDEQGEKTGWTYFKIPASLAEQLKPGNRKSFRVKGKLDSYAINGVALLPMGEGDFIMPLNASIRKAIGKNKGAKLKVQLTEDKKKPEVDSEFMECLADEPGAMNFFNSLPRSHQLYFSKWITSAKTGPTKAKRIAQAVTGLARKMNYGEMIRYHRDNKSAME